MDSSMFIKVYKAWTRDVNATTWLLLYDNYLSFHKIQTNRTYNHGQPYMRHQSTLLLVMRHMIRKWTIMVWKNKLTFSSLPRQINLTVVLVLCSVTAWNIPVQEAKYTLILTTPYLLIASSTRQWNSASHDARLFKSYVAPFLHELVTVVHSLYIRDRLL